MIFARKGRGKNREDGGKLQWIAMVRVERLAVGRVRGEVWEVELWEVEVWEQKCSRPWTVFCGLRRSGFMVKVRSRNGRGNASVGFIKEIFL